MISLQKTLQTLLTNLTARQKEVIEARFGLNKKKESETLASIGEAMDITRERVRQIEKSGLDLIKEHILKTKDAVEILNRLVKYIKSCGGVVRKDFLINYAAEFAPGINENYIQLFVEASGAFSIHHEDAHFSMFYYTGKKELETAKNFIHEWITFVRGKKDEILAGHYKKYLDEFIKSKNTPKLEAENFLSVSKKIHINSYGDIGLREWPEIHPKTTRDKIYIILKKRKKPLHFQDIAHAINKSRLSAQLALSPTVHNELIKDPRFVLVGRGIYGLQEHGYEPGVAREIIQKILKRNGPLAPEEIITKVNEQRFFKPNTIIINLQNKAMFEKLEDGNYRAREA